MDSKKLERWAQQLLDTGRRNNLINFKDTKASTIELVYPDADKLYEKCLNTSSFEVYDPKILDDEDDEEAVASAYKVADNQDSNSFEGLKKSDYIAMYSGRIKKNNQVLVYARTPNPITAVKNIDKKARDFLEETGVNVAYLAFGFVYWKESETSSIINRAPLLLVPVSLYNESAITPYIINLTEDDVVVNPTFDYMLKAQYGINLPEHEDDESLPSYLAKVRDVVSKLHWNVVSECKLGIFSFLKINMYYDLKNNSDVILKNKNVRQLLGESVVLSDASEVSEEGHIENEIIDLHTVVDADSSQIEAIEMAKTNKSFVLQGPPGTGKSQTITNIIAECLHDGKKVLFVSEKLAALNVVYEKLKHAGLDEFCLELHSYKASKKEVIAELCRTLKANRSTVSKRADDEVRKKERLQVRLDAYAEELHKPIPVINKSLYQLYEDYSACRKGKDLELLIDDISNKNEEYFNEAVSLIGQYVDYIPTIGADYRQNEWYGYSGQNSSFESQGKLKNDIQVIIDGLGRLIPETNNCKKQYQIELESIIDAEKYAQLFNVLSTSQFLKPNALKKENIQMLLDSVNEMADTSSNIISLKQNIEVNFEDSIYNINGPDYYNKLTKLYSSFTSRLFNAEYKSIISDIRLASKTGSKPNYAMAMEYMRLLCSHQNLTNQFNIKKSELSNLFVVENISVESDWERMTTELELIQSCFESGLSCGIIADMSEADFVNQKELFATNSKSIGSALGTFRPVVIELQKEFDSSLVSFSCMPLNELYEKMGRCRESFGKAENWVRFYILLNQLKERGLLTFIDTAIEYHVPDNAVVDSYKRLFYKQWINYAINEKPVFANFTRITQDRTVEEFAEKDKLQFDISKAQIKAELSANRPSLNMMAGGSAVSILLREGEKKRKQKSIRRLLEETGELVQILKPCFLMSPLSVSTFLSENSISFDTVIFDEASQIFPQDAVGGIYRGKQVIVVGDSKQMPPSNFFNTSLDIDDDDEETGDITDFESILDLCSTSFPQYRLRWHYRSRYEQLIAFSNKNFYDNALVTFPSSTVDREGIGVDYYYVNGTFDRHSHTNRKEAEFIIDLIYKNIEMHPNRSLGVVAFSVAQQDLIERLLSKRRQDDPSQEWFFKRDDSIKEPFFIKNLETVQGDERDTIIFSVAYGKDIQGRLLHNFGPLNRVGGERRLNVAVSRAKDNVQLVSSMHGTDIDLKRTSAEGARLLKEYLDYAEKGEIALESVISVNPFEQFDSDFEMEVCEFLREHGFSVDTQVGCSGFRIDLGLKQPNTSDYVLAIECDGATYHSLKNARDRDRLRQEILERMGWRFYRIWSTDWFRNNAVEKERLLKAATEAIHLGHYVKEEAEGISEENTESFEVETQQVSMAFPEYKEAYIPSFVENYRYNRLALVKAIMKVEAPVYEEYLLRRICYIYGREKVTSVVRQQFGYDMRGCEKEGIIRSNGFLYFMDQTNYMLRVPGVKRDIRIIAPQELAAGMIIVIEQNITVEKEGLYRTIVNLLGFTRMSDAICAQLDKAFSLIRDRIVVENDVISLK